MSAWPRGALGAAAVVLLATLAAASLEAEGARGEVSRLDGLDDAPFPPVPGAPQVIVRAGHPEQPADVVLYLHGYEGCVEVLAASERARCRVGAPLEPGWALLDAFEESRAPSWFLLPQLAFHARDGSPGRLARRGGARRLIEASLARVAGARGHAPPPLGRVTLVAHSAAFESAIAVLRVGGLDETLEDVVLLDAMYSGVPVFAAWALRSPTHSLVALSTAGSTPERRARELVERYGARLAGRLRSGEAASVEDVARGRVVLARARTSHRDVPRRYLGPILARLSPAEGRGP